MGRGKPLVLIHGWGVNGALFEPQLSALASRYRVIVPDLPGHGTSGPVAEGAGLSVLSDAIAELLGHLELKQVCLVGWSLGAMVSWDLLQRHQPEAISRLVCIDMVPCLSNETDFPHGLIEPRGEDVFKKHAQLIKDLWPGYTDKMVPRIFRPDDSDHTRALISWAGRVARRNDPVSLGNVWQAMGKADLRSALAGISIPTLVIAGHHSQLYGAAAGQWVAERIAGAQLVIFEHSGHAPQLEEPERFNQLLAEFAGHVNANAQHASPPPVHTGLEP
jgi:pimeloyl-[acyl-carrier protein] methyl ester esterase